MGRAGSRPKLEKPSAALGKFTRPRPVGALSRLRLFSALDAARERPAVWVAAPPGAGKTTLVSTYVAQRRLRTLWYRVHEEDVDPATFFHYFGMAADAVAPRKGRAALPHLTPEYLLNLPAFSRRYFEQVYQRLEGPALLVLDNYQEVPREAALHEVMRQAIESLPPEVNVLVVSRGEPPPALAALRANGAIALVSGEDLRLSIEECGELARLRKADIDAADLEALYKRTLGWTAGVVLALEQKGSPAVEAPPVETTPQLLFDYFGGEIFDRMPRESQLVLLQASFLPSMAGRRVAELTGTAAAEALLESLTRSNYFTLRLARPHPAPAVYHFHPLFREFLLRRAQETLPAAALLELRKKAAALLEADGETADAMVLLIAAQAWDEATRLMLAHAREMLEQGRGRVLEEWLRALPAELRGRTPWALYWLGMSRLAFDQAEGALQVAARLRPVRGRGRGRRAVHRLGEPDRDLRLRMGGLRRGGPLDRRARCAARAPSALSLAGSGGARHRRHVHGAHVSPAAAPGPAALGGAHALAGARRLGRARADDPRQPAGALLQLLAGRPREHAPHPRGGAPAGERGGRQSAHPHRLARDGGGLPLVHG